jgi:hypothetical protein
LLSFVLSIAPVGIYFFLNRHRYFVTLPDKVKITVGLVCLVFIVFLKVMGKLRMPSRAVLFGFVMIMCYLMERVLDDLLVFSFLALVGEVLDLICQHFIRKAREERLLEKSAKRTAEEIERVLNGRV